MSLQPPIEALAAIGRNVEQLRIGLPRLSLGELSRIAFERPRVAEEWREYHALVSEKKTRRGSYFFVVRCYDREGNPL
jgi:hypothetical protein